jgi:2,4-dienoyl-CoA reductase-like NADH-dependent reductase (Old Yellow Enzyme family)
MTEPSPLLAPLDIGASRPAPNRIWLAPMTNSQSHADGTLADEELRWLLARAQGGFGVIQSCATHVQAHGQGWPGELGIYSDLHLEGWQRLVHALHDAGALVLPQLFHGGARADRRVTGVQPWSASPVEGSDAVREGTEADIHDAIEAFVAAAHRAHRAGADGIELHGAHGYLLCQFLSTTLNRRTDDWGGPLQHRARLLRIVTARIRAELPAGFSVGVRISPENFGQLTGLDLDESLTLAGWLADDGIDFLHISLWDAHKPSCKRPDTHPLPLFRDALPPQVKLVVAGNLWTREDAESMLELGADAVALGRSAIANPDWPRTVAAAGAAPLRPPLTAQQLLDRALSPGFVDYMRRWPGFVTEEA